MDLPLYVQSLSFRAVTPAQSRSHAAHVLIAGLMRLGLPLDRFNTRLPREQSAMQARLRRYKPADRQLPFAVAAILNHAAGQLPPDQAFLAIGCSHSSVLDAATAGNAQAIGLAADRLASHRPEDGVQSILADRHIGVCVLSGESSAAAARHLSGIEPHLAENACVIVQGTNEPAIHRACLAFLETTANQFRVVLDERPTHPCQLTFGNGLFVMQLLGRNAAARVAEPTRVRPAA